MTRRDDDERDGWNEIIVRIDKPSNPREERRRWKYLTVAEWKTSGKVSSHQARIRERLDGRPVGKRWENGATVATEKNTVDQAHIRSVRRDCSQNPVQWIWIINKKLMIMRLVKERSDHYWLQLAEIQSLINIKICWLIWNKFVKLYFVQLQTWQSP